MKSIRPRFSVLLAFAATLFTASVASAAGSATQPSICDRGCWSARASTSNHTTMGALNRAIIHHTAGASDWNTTSQTTSKAIMRATQNYHMDSNGWSDIGYHFLVDKLGNRFEGRYRSLTSTPRGAHDGTNTDSFGFTILGYLHTPYNQTPSTTCRNALYDIIAWKMPNGWSPYGSGTYNSKTVGRLAGHRDVKATACPGDLMYTYIGTNYSGGEARNAVNSRINSAPVEVIVDNDTSAFTASTNWWAGSSTSGYYGSNYRVRSAESISDAATWKGNIPSAGTYTVYVRYTEGSNRASSAPYIVYHTGGSTTKYVNQTTGGGSWVSLGSFSLAQGSTSTRVALSCWTSSGEYVIADAVRFVKQ